MLVIPVDNVGYIVRSTNHCFVRSSSTTLASCDEWIEAVDNNKMGS